MQVTQIASLMNNVTGEILGNKELFAEDLSNVVDAGKEILNNSDVDNYVRSLIDHVGRIVFVNRPYTGSAPSVLMDSWEFGSVLEKVTMDLPEATENESWELEDGTSYDPNIFYKPSVTAKFFNKRITFEVPVSITELQVKSSFTNAAQLNGFISMIYTAVEKSLSIKVDALVKRTINNMTAETLHAEYPSGDYTAKSGVRAVNLLKLYNDRFAKELTAANALTDLDFLRFAAYQMGLYESRLEQVSSLFNIGGKDRFTPADMLHVVLLADFSKAANAYLQSETFHNEYTALPNAETMTFWQGSGSDYAFAETSKIHVKTSGNNTVEASGIIGVMFDRDALGVTNLDRRVTTNYNPKAEFFNNWYKYDAGYFNDFNENFVVFFVA